ncbi:PREDICTED: F-box/LRR-repeat protein 20-like [Fragaria vesca subsp. vesca]|uniref:F-box/LRR-repeat protein 20-like n=1 Tax=Fragaria vesca subsp. vesca TaxID=101020 RepID=UPI0002C2FBC3|nr:PREDICTED: F-box/LRR-repeat protein 20-like [Fragaria vesca subsp. vesca]XP_011466475.1 PREDICTED: F-box/LRR-repeat protein 20-like [Fragaria vesca subsp. vesca]XP_011466476.1 PREDICTED: F-box/LRR-repeat protein 20-like [Fragaria vesca subsp. vesca]
MSKIGHDELGQILDRITDPADRKSTSQVCKGWWLIEAQSRTSLRVNDPHHLPRLLARYPNLTTFETPRGMSNADLALVAQSCPKLEAFILDDISISVEIGRQGMRALGYTYPYRVGDEDALGISNDEAHEILRVVNEVGDQGLCALADGCPKLSKIVLRRTGAGLLGIMTMITSAAHNLTHLDLEGCSLVTDQVLEAIGSSSCPIRILSLRFCSEITDAGLRFLANGSCSKTMEQLNLSSCREITDDGVLLLCNMCVLEELDLRYCNQLTDIGGQAISTIRTLKKLNLDCLFNLTEETFVAVAENCINLEVLNLQQCHVTAASIDAFLGHKCLRCLNLFCCISHDIKGSTLESLALGCPSLESIVVHRTWRQRLVQDMQENTVSRFLKFWFN